MSTSSNKSRVQSLRNRARPFTARKFDFDGVEGLSRSALELHQSLYEGYVKECNALLPYVYTVQSSQELSPLERLQLDGIARRFAFERNGIVLHELFFETLRGPADPPHKSCAFLEAIERSYGAFVNWQDDVRGLAQTRGVGWVLTVHAAADERVANIWVDEHTHGLIADAKVLCAFDLWEHAYLLDYKPSERSKYLQTIFDNMDWEAVEARCESHEATLLSD